MPRRRIPKDPYAPVADLSNTDSEYLKVTRKVLLATIEIGTGDKVQKDTRVKLYMQRIVEDATTKRGASVRHLRQLRAIQALEPNGPAARPVTSLTPYIQLQDRRCAFAYEGFWPTFFALLPCFRRAYGAVHGDLGDVTKVLPIFMRSDPSLADCLDRVRKLKRKKAKGQPFVVGHKKPLVDTQFAKGRSGNKAGRPKTETFFEALDSSLHRKISVRKADGTSKQVGQCEVGITQLFNDAMNGNSRARTEINALIKALHIAGKLEPDPPSTPLRRPTDKGKVLAAARVAIMVPIVKRFLVERFDKTYGPIPAFTTLLEQNTPGLNDIPGLDALCEKDPRFGAVIDRIKTVLMGEEMRSETSVEIFDDAEAVSGSAPGHGFEAGSAFDAAIRKTSKANADDAPEIIEPQPHPVTTPRSRVTPAPKGTCPPITTIRTKGKKGKKREPGGS